MSGAKFVVGRLSRWSDKLALDPPEPDPRYAERVEPSPPAVPEDIEPESLRPVLGPIARSLAAVDALEQIEGRLLGARDADDGSAMRLQAGSYREVTGQPSTCRRLRQPDSLTSVPSA